MYISLGLMAPAAPLSLNTFQDSPPGYARLHWRHTHCGWWAVGPGRNWGCIHTDHRKVTPLGICDSTGKLGYTYSILYWPSRRLQKRARKAFPDALRGRIWGLLLKDERRYGAIGAVGVNLRLVWVCGEWVAVTG